MIKYNLKTVIKVYSQINILEQNYILYPVHLGAHWTLLVHITNINIYVHTGV